MKVTVWTILCGFSNGTKPNGIYTEKVNSSLLHELVQKHMQDIGATVLPSVGFYGGTEEAGASVIIIDDGTAKDVKRQVEHLANEYRRLANQVEVWITQETKVLHKIKN